MQGTVVMLMALSGLGCHNKSCDVAYAPPAYSCFSGGCYANVYPPDYVSPSCYSGCYSSCYSGCYSSYGGSCYGGCYSGSYGGHHGCGFLPSSLAASSTLAAMAAMAAATAAMAARTAASGVTTHLMTRRFSVMRFSTITGQWTPTRAHPA